MVNLEQKYLENYDLTLKMKKMTEKRRGGVLGLFETVPFYEAILCNETKSGYKTQNRTGISKGSGTCDLNSVGGHRLKTIKLPPH